MFKSFKTEEKKALVAICKFIAHSDGKITEAEIIKFNEIAEEKGFEDFSEIFQEVDREVTSLDDIKELIKKVDRQTHKNDILRIAMEIAIADATLVPEEVEIIKMIGKAWNIDIKALLKGKR